MGHPLLRRNATTPGLRPDDPTAPDRVGTGELWVMRRPSRVECAVQRVGDF
jgi:hypothetical protein